MAKFIIPRSLCASVPSALDNDTVKNIWRGFTFNVSELTTDPSHKEASTIISGEISVPELPSNKEYSYRICESGFAVRAKDKEALMRGFFDLMMQVEYENDGTLYMQTGDKTSSFLFDNRMIHICAFAQTRFSDLRKLVRLSAAVGYTHAVLEFWGTFPYECEPRLSWDEAYSRDELRDLAKEMRELGIKPIPMINHLGHAASGRVTGGKHSVLDRAPELYRYFTPDGWSWDIRSPYVRELLKKMRAEQYDVFGDCEYFHLGMDEAYMYATSPEHRAALPEYLSYITDEIVKEGKRPLIWMDMFLPPESGTKHICSCRGDEDMYAALGALNKKTVLVDWQYNFGKAPYPTTDYIVKKNTGFDVMCAPWMNHANFTAGVKTTDMLGIFGFMMTTWHSMAIRMSCVLEAARAFGAPKAPWSDMSGSVEGKREECATLIRKLAFEGVKTYRDAGWCDEEITLSVGTLW